MRVKIYFSLFVACLIVIINYYASFYQFYWILPWFDIPMHILGGFVIALFTQVCMDHFNHHKVNKNRVSFAILSAFIVGIIWEFTEWHLGITTGLSPASRLDTIKDVIDDIIGGALSVWIWNFLFNKNKINANKRTEQPE